MKQVEVSAHFLFIGMNYADFRLQCLSNEKGLFSETLSPKHHDQVYFDKKVIRIQYWFHLLQHRLPFSKILTPGNKYLLCHQVRGKVLTQNYVHFLVLITGKFVMLE